MVNIELFAIVSVAPRDVQILFAFIVQFDWI